MKRKLFTKEDLISGCWIAFRLMWLFVYIVCLSWDEYIFAGVVLAVIVSSCMLQEVIANKSDSS